MISVIRVGCALAITIAGVAGAAAADLELNAPPPLAPFRAPPPLIFNWTGCYLGGHGGYAYTDRVVTGTILGPIIDGALVNVADTLPIEFAANGALIGGQVGCNYQFARSWVIGFEVDAAWANVNSDSRQTLAGTFPGIFGVPTTSSSDGTLSIKSDFIATATARLGYTFGSIGQGLIYGKGGAAWIANRYTFTGSLQSTGCIAAAIPPGQCTATGTLIVPFNWTTRETRTGWTIGVGIEWAILGKWTIKGEYDYLDFGTKNVTLNDATLGATTISGKQTVSEVKLGINYRFGVPLVASY